MKAIFKQDTAAIFDAKARAVRAYNLMQWARWATFGLYIVAVFMLYVSDVWGIATYIEKNSNEYVALVVFSVTSFILAYFLASSKEAVYEDIALGRSEGYKPTRGQIFAMVLFASAGILFELFSATSNQQHISNNAADQAGLLKPAEVGSVSINTPPALTTALMSAQASLNKCRELMKQGRMKDCNVSEGKVAGARDAIEMSNQTAAAVSGELVDKTNARNERLLERFDKPMFKAVGKAVGGDTNDGMIIAVAVMITIFELQHILSVFAYGNALRRMNADKLGKRTAMTPAVEPEPQTAAPDLAAPETGSGTGTEKMPKYLLNTIWPEGTQAAPVSKLQQAGEAIGNEMMKAQGARNRMHDQMQKQADKLADRLDSKVSTQPAPAAPTPRMSVAETIRAIVGSVQQAGASSSADILAATTAAYSNLFNPADLDAGDLQKVAAKIARDLMPAPATPTTPDYLKGSESTTPAKQATPTTPDYLKGSERGGVAQLYPLWIAGVMDGSVRVSEGAFSGFVNTHVDSKQLGFNKAKLAEIWDSFGLRGVDEGRLQINPDYQPGNRKQKYILA